MRERKRSRTQIPRRQFTTPGGIHVCTNEHTFLQFLSSHCLTPSSWVRISGASKNLALGPPSFFGPSDSIFHRFLTTKRDNSDHEATRRAQTWHASEVGCGCTGRTSIAAKNTYQLYDGGAHGINYTRRNFVYRRAMILRRHDACFTNANSNKLSENIELARRGGW